MDIKISIKNLDDAIRAFRSAPTEMVKALEGAVATGATQLFREGVIEAPADTSTLRGSFTSEVSQLHAEVYPTSKYGIFVHEGTAPHAVSARHLQGWAKRKGMNPALVAAKIRARGTKANPFLKRAVDKLTRPIERVFEKYIEEALNKIAGSIGRD